MANIMGGWVEVGTDIISIGTCACNRMGIIYTCMDIRTKYYWAYYTLYMYTKLAKLYSAHLITLLYYTHCLN